MADAARDDGPDHHLISPGRTHRRRAGPALCLLVAVTIGGCQWSGMSSAGAPSSSPQRFTVCSTAAPDGWMGRPLATLPGTDFSVSAVTPDGDRAFGSYRTASGEQGIAAVDLAGGTLTPVAAFPAGSADPVALAVDPPWLAWVQATSPAKDGPWTLQARDLDTGEQFTVATSRLPDGTDTSGVPTSLVVKGGRLAWAQPMTKPGPMLAGGVRAGVQPVDEVRVYDLAARRQTVLGPGGGPFVAGSYLVWSRAGGVLQSVDWSTLRPVDLPAAVRRLRGGVVIASSDVLVWSYDNPRLMAWRIDRGRIATYDLGGQDQRQYTGVAGHLLVWSTAARLMVLDLDSGGAYEMAQPGSIAGSAGAIVRTAPLRTTDPWSGTAMWVLQTASARGIPHCG